MNFSEQQSRVYEKALNQRYENVIPPDQAIKNLLETKISFSAKETKLVKLCSLLCEWITCRTTLDLEEKYFCRSGQIEQIGKRVSWLTDSAWGIAKVLNADKRLVHFLKRLSLKVNFGVDDVGIKFAHLRVPGLGRDYIWSLVREGFCSLKKIKEAKFEELEQVIPRQVAQRLSEIPSKAGKEKIEERSKHPKKSEFVHRTQIRGSTRKKNLGYKFEIQSTDQISLVIDGTPVKDKFLVLVNGRKTNLSAKSFKYLVKLAWAAFRNEGGWIHKNDFEPGENQTKYLHRLKKQIKPNLDTGQSIIENNRLGCYRLNVPKDEIRIDAPALPKNPDTEIKSMAEQLVELMSESEKPE